MKRIGELPRPPFLLVADHLSALDPFLVSAFSSYSIVWVANRPIFNHLILGSLIRGVGAIPKRKEIPDPRAALAIFRALEEGKAVGLFPEGTITPDGVSQEVA